MGGQKGNGEMEGEQERTKTVPNGQDATGKTLAHAQRARTHTHTLLPRFNATHWEEGKVGGGGGGSYWERYSKESRRFLRNC